jgi:cytoskeletal protein CcmA (bactofilin family)
MSSRSDQRSDQQSHGATTIGQGVKIVGEILSKQDLCIMGEVEGNIRAVDHKVVVEPGSRVQADIFASDVIIFGNVQGNVEARNKVALQSGARMAGNIASVRVGIEDGAFFKGKIDTRKLLHGHISPCGNCVAYTSDETGRYEVYVAPFPGSGGGRQVSQAGGLLPQWSARGKELFYSGLDARLMAVEIAIDGKELKVGTVRPC